MTNREFKFRIWVNGKMLTTNEIGSEYIFNAEQYDHPVMQCTGLKDCNGKDIYEGDLMKCNFEDNTKKVDSKIVWMGAGFRICPVNWNGRTYYEHLTESEINDMELIVVGNIYETPELINKKEPA
jgi:uncharacterized phage protein (TIGR01671 family)